MNPRPARGKNVVLWAVLLVPGLWLADSHAQVNPDGSTFIAPPLAKAKRVRKPPPEAAPAPGEVEPAGEGLVGKCGVERWGVKTLSDPDVDKVDFSSIQDVANVADLSGQPGQSVWPSFDPAHPVYPPDARIISSESQGYAGPGSLETAVIRLHGSIVCYKAEADHDYHVVIADSSLPPDQIPDCNHWPQSGPLRGQTMIVEFSDPGCPGASQSEFKGQLGDARRQFQQFLASVRQPQPGAQFVSIAPPIPVVVRGVKFFDPYHRQSGVSRFGVELHPVLCFKGASQLGGGSECDPY